jgi:histidinol-phosphate aminotransferase
LGFNELPFKPTEKVSLAIEKIRNNAGYYGDPMCLELRKAIEKAYGINRDHIICGNGSEELLDVIARNFVNSEDEVLISQFGYIQFVLAANRLNASLRKSSEVKYHTCADNLLKLINSKTKLIFVANPNNPTGTFIPINEIKRLLTNIPSNVVLVMDLAYGEFVGFDYCNQVHDLVEQFSNLVVTRTFSKAFGLAGLRVGWCHAPKNMIYGFYAARGMGSVNAMAQSAATAALSELDEIQSRIDLIISERERVAAALLDLNIETLPSYANFLLATISGQDEELIEKLVQFLFNEAGIIVNRTREKGLERFMRFSLSLPEHNDLMIKTCKRFMNFNSIMIK